MKTTNNENRRGQYFEVSTKVGLAVDKCLLNYLSENQIGKDKELFYQPMLGKKLGHQKARANAVFLSYCALSNLNPLEETSMNEDVTKIATSVELLIGSHYLSNWIYDNKASVKEPLIRKKTAIGINGMLADAINIVTKLDGKSDYISLILDINDSVLKSWVPEITKMNITNQGLINDPLFVNYHNRFYGGYGVGENFKGCVKFAELLAKDHGILENKDKVNELEYIFYNFGVHCEILNELGDFILDKKVTSEKNSLDQYADFKNDTLTIPIFWMYNLSDKTGKDYILKCAGNQEIDIHEKKDLLKMLFESGSYEKVSKELKKEGRKSKKRAHNLQFNKEVSAPLQQMLSIYESNKIYHLLQQDYNSVIKEKEVKQNV